MLYEGKILERIFSYMPEELQKNLLTETIFQNIIEIIPPHSYIDLSLAPEILLKVMNEYPEYQNKIKSCGGENSIFYFNAITSTNVVALKIRYISSNELELNVRTLAHDGKKKEINILFIGDIIRAYYLEEEEKQHIIKSYKHELYYYDRKTMQSLSRNTEQEKREIFAKYFCIGIKEAEYYYEHFRENYQKLSENKYKSEMDYFNQITTDNLFHSPVKIEDLEEFVYSEIEKEGALMSDEEYIPYKYTKTGALDNLISEIKAIIGQSDKIIISDHLFQELSFYLLGISPNILYTKGIIINKYEGQFSAYYVHFEEKKIVAFQLPISKEDIKALLKNNPENEKIEGLDDFLGEGNILK